MDLRWKNIVKHVQKAEWFLVDLNDVVITSEKFLFRNFKNLNEDSHTPDIFLQVF